MAESSAEEAGIVRGDRIIEISKFSACCLIRKLVGHVTISLLKRARWKVLQAARLLVCHRMRCKCRVCKTSAS